MNPREYRLLSNRMTRLDSEISTEKAKPKKERNEKKLSIYLKIKNTLKEWMKS